MHAGDHAECHGTVRVRSIRPANTKALIPEGTYTGRAPDPPTDVANIMPSRPRCHNASARHRCWFIERESGQLDLADLKRFNRLPATYERLMQPATTIREEMTLHAQVLKVRP